MAKQINKTAKVSTAKGRNSKVASKRLPASKRRRLASKRQPAPAAAEPAPQPVAVASSATYNPTLVAGKAYAPRGSTLQGNALSWAEVLACLQANGGACTLQQLQQHLATTRNHANFAKYCIRRGWLVPQG